ncbi:hypothetical protein E3U55_08755 [Filobacillus milosensis]|uniref:Uncharacterized protein n=1 Tax=Filobacillus milosensis TaxID=94137 RepID=A0A4Y8IKC1_9BACI|nr:hypothetical protein [Filobacillus milosensis]TFB21394.1 hypothetical protein E3U55_08755 [Filobacillus milosensis]
MSQTDRNKRDLKHKDKIADMRDTIYEERRNELHKFKDEQLVDDIPLEDLEIEEKNNRKKKNSQSTSQSEEKYKK